MNRGVVRHAPRRAPALASITIGTVITPVMAFTQFDGCSEILFAFINDDIVNPIDVLIETSEDGVAVDGERTFTLTIPGTASGTPVQRSLEILNNIRGWYRVSATANGGNATMRWSLRATPRPHSH